MRHTLIKLLRVEDVDIETGTGHYLSADRRRLKVSATRHCLSCGVGHSLDHGIDRGVLDLVGIGLGQAVVVVVVSPTVVAVDVVGPVVTSGDEDLIAALNPPPAVTTALPLRRRSMYRRLEGVPQHERYSRAPAGWPCRRRCCTRRFVSGPRPAMHSRLR